jgi:hypothetical protein
MDNSHEHQPASSAPNQSPGLADWTPEQIARGKQWVRAWEAAGTAMEALRREELRKMDGYRAIELLCGPADYHVAPRAPKPTSGLIEQQRWFMKAAAGKKNASNKAAGNEP